MRNRQAQALALADFVLPSAIQPTLRTPTEQVPQLSTVAIPCTRYVRQQANSTRSLFCSGNGGQSVGWFETTPLIELGDCSPPFDRATNAPTSCEAGVMTQTLLQNVMQMIEALLGAVQTLSAIPKCGHPAVMRQPTAATVISSPPEISLTLSHYQRAMGSDDQDVLGRVVPAALTDMVVRWYRLTGYRAATLEEFRLTFLREFLSTDYESTMRQELELRIQAPEESLQEYVFAMDELYSIAEPQASNEENFEQVIRRALFQHTCATATSGIWGSWAPRQSAFKATFSRQVLITCRRQPAIPLNCAALPEGP